MSVQIDEISRAIGSLEAQLGNLTDMLTKHVATSEATRRTMHKLEEDVRTMKEDVAEMRPVIKKVERWEQRALGISAGVSAVVAIIGVNLADKLRGWFS